MKAGVSQMKGFLGGTGSKLEKQPAGNSDFVRPPILILMHTYVWPQQPMSMDICSELTVPVTPCGFGCTGTLGRALS